VKLLRLKITDPVGFRSLHTGFEHYFRKPWDLQEGQGLAPFVCAGPNGSGKSNLLEVLAAIFYQLELLRVRRSFLPDAFFSNDDSDVNHQVVNELDSKPSFFELEYLIPIPKEYQVASGKKLAHVRVIKADFKKKDKPYSKERRIQIEWVNAKLFNTESDGTVTERERDFLLPQYVLGYSSGENEILSLPFFKMRFVQFDEYWNALKNQLPYPGRPETRLAYLDNSFSQAILLCNLLFYDAETLKPFSKDVGVDALKEFRIIIRRSIDTDIDRMIEFARKDEYEKESIEEMLNNHPAIVVQENESGREKRYRVNLMKLLEADAGSDKNFDPIVTRLKRCATCSFVDEATDTLYLDYYVNDATKEAFKENFDQSPIALFQAFQVLLTLNLYPVSDALKSDLYKSDSLYVGETVPVLSSDERVMRFKHFWLKKTEVNEPVLLKSLSDGEHQLLHSLGLCLLFKNTNSLFLLDEPETHFNPDWRSNFITQLHQCFRDSEDTHEMLVTTHTPFLISDSKPEKVLVFKKTDGTVKISNPEYNTFGASINKITMTTFEKSTTIGGHAQQILEKLRSRFEAGEDKEQLIDDINRQLGDSVEKVLLIKTILDSMEEQG